MGIAGPHIFLVRHGHIIVVDTVSMRLSGMAVVNLPQLYRIVEIDFFQEIAPEKSAGAQNPDIFMEDHPAQVAAVGKGHGRDPGDAVRDAVHMPLSFGKVIDEAGAVR